MKKRDGLEIKIGPEEKDKHFKKIIKEHWIVNFACTQ